MARKEYYSEQQFKDGCWINFIMGTCFGISFTLITEALYFYFRGWIW